ncbi:MAG: alpha/beta hydrolase [Actinomycetaceae bacterium]
MSTRTTGAPAQAAPERSSATAHPNSTARRTWYGPDGIAPRGTLVLLVGRGETPDVYERFGRRLSSDAYVVVAVQDEDGARAVLADPGLPRPFVVVGSDAGAAGATRVARGDDRVQGVVLVGLLTDHAGAGGPGPGAAVSGPTADLSGPAAGEAPGIEARTACPNHRKVLAAHATVALPGADATGLLALSPDPEDGPLGVPALAIHGGADPVSGVEAARAAYRALGVDELVVVDGGLHDALNDVTHRSVAATLVLFLERLRLGAGLEPVVRVGRP